MKQIIPFKKDLLFKTKVSEVTSISLEHNFKIDSDVISGNFFISGDYKMTEGSINRENFDFKLPFDIALDSRYKEDSMLVDIDNFYYQIVNDDTLQVHIDLYVDGEKDILTDELLDENVKFEDLVRECKEQECLSGSVDVIDAIDANKDTSSIDIEQAIINRKESLMDNELLGENEVEGNININQNTNIDNYFESMKSSSFIDKGFNVLDNVDDGESYKSYYVYIVKEDDNVDKILEKYGITKEELALYNDLENIKMGDKVIIPSKNE